MRRRRGGHLVWLGGALVVLAACGSKAPPPPAAPAPQVAATCPDLTKADELAAFDFAKEYVLSREAADKLKAAALASLEVTTLADKLDADLGIACAQIAHDLGNKGDWRSGNEACAAAIKSVHDTRAKLGAKSAALLVARQPVCDVDATLMTKCASICDSSVPAEKVKADCEQRVGRCDGQCDGLCELKDPVKCDGTCSGTCDGAVKGTCGGKCRGTCDGKAVNGPCLGVCAGTCSGAALSGECKGTCSGACKPLKAGTCGGVCTGACSVELADVKCSGAGFKTPEVSTDCRARCEIAAMNQTECPAPQASLAITGAKDRESAELLKASVDKSFPSLLQTLDALGDKGAKRIMNAHAVIESARTGLKDMALSGGKASAPASEAQLVKCFDEPFKKAAEAALAVKTGIDQAVSVRDEASK